MSADLEEHYDKIYRYCYMRLGQQQAAEDAAQETFLRFLQNASYREMGKKLAYLYTIARNLCMDSRREKVLLPLEEEMAGAVEEEKQVLDSLALRAALQKLSPEEQELIFLRYVNEVPVGEIAEIFGISRFSVHRRIKESLKKLKTYME